MGVNKSLTCKYPYHHWSRRNHRTLFHLLGMCERQRQNLAFIKWRLVSVPEHSCPLFIHGTVCVIPPWLPFRSKSHTNLPTCFSKVRLLLSAGHTSSNIFLFPPTDIPAQLKATGFQHFLGYFLTVFCSLSHCIMDCYVLRLCRLHKYSFISMPCMNHES